MAGDYTFPYIVEPGVTYLNKSQEVMLLEQILATLQLILESIKEKS